MKLFYRGMYRENRTLWNSANTNNRDYNKEQTAHAAEWHSVKHHDSFWHCTVWIQSIICKQKNIFIFDHWAPAQSESVLFQNATVGKNHWTNQFLLNIKDLNYQAVVQTQFLIKSFVLMDFKIRKLFFIDLLKCTVPFAPDQFSSPAP